MSDLTPLFKPKSVALIGASANTTKYGYWTAKSLLEGGYKGRVYLITRSGGEILGHETYTDISKVPGDVDLAIIAIAPKYILPVIEQCSAKGVKVGIVVSTGFGETGEEGKKLERKMLATARRGGMRLMGPNCMGMYSAAASINASIIDLAPGNMSLVLQSGNFGIDINFNAKQRNLGYSCWCSIGNQLDLRFSDFVSYIADDEETRVLLLYMEGLRKESEADGRNFIEAARRTSLRRPIAAIKIGRSAAGARAAASHTGSLAGSAKVFDSALKQCGIVRCDSPNELLDVAETFVKSKPAFGRRVAVLTDGGGHGVMATDFCEKYNLEAPVLSEETQNRFRAVLQPHCPIKNPVDLAGTPEHDMWVFDRSLEILLDDPDIDGVIIVGLYGGYKDLSDEFAKLEMDVAKSMADHIARSGKPVVMHSIYQPQHPESLQYLSEHGVPLFDSVQTAVRAMGALVEYSQSRRQLQEEMDAPAPDLPADRMEKANEIFAKVRSEGRVNLVEPEARAVLDAYGLKQAPYYLATNAAEASEYWKKLSAPAAMKIVSPDILHKTDAGGVCLNVRSAEEAAAAYDRLVANGLKYRPDASIFGVMLTPMLPGGVECIIGAIQDSTFGPVIMFGLGGIFVEVLKDVSFRVAPVRMPECLRMIQEIKGAAMLGGVRGKKPCDIPALARTASTVSYMVDELRDIAEVDLNPVFALENGLAIADARIVLRPRG